MLLKNILFIEFSSNYHNCLFSKNSTYFPRFLWAIVSLTGLITLMSNKNFVGNKAKWQISKRLLQKNKANMRVHIRG